MCIKTLITCVKNVFEILVHNEVVSWYLFKTSLKTFLGCLDCVLQRCWFDVFSLLFVWILLFSLWLFGWLIIHLRKHCLVSKYLFLSLFMRADASLSLDWSISLSIIYFSYEVSLFVHNLEVLSKCGSIVLKTPTIVVRTCVVFYIFWYLFRGIGIYSSIGP